MFFRSNAAKRWPVDEEVIHSGEQKTVGYPQDLPCYPQAVHNLDDADLVWPNGSDAPVDRQTFLAELLAERFGLPIKASRLKSGEPGRGVSATSRTTQPTQGDKS